MRFYLLIYTADFLGLSFPISQRRGWPHEVKRLPLLWYLVIFRNEETTLGFFMGLSWRGSRWEVWQGLLFTSCAVLYSEHTGRHTDKHLCLHVPRLLFLQILWASLCCEGDFAVRRDWHSDVGRMLSRRFGDQSVTLSGAGQVACEWFSLGPLANGCVPVGSTLLVILLF